MDLEGRIVEFVDSGTLRMAYVRKQEQRKIQVVDQRGRYSSVPVSRVIVTHAPIPEQDFPAAAMRIEEQVEASVAEIDPGFLWESVHPDPREFTTPELALSYFGVSTPETESAIYRVLSQTPLFFRRTAIGFVARSEEQVSAERLRLAREEEREGRKVEITRLLRGALDETSTPGDFTGEAEWSNVLDALERWLRRNEANETGDVLEKIQGEAQAREAAYHLLRRHERIAPDEDRFMLVRGMPTEFPQDVLLASESLVLRSDNEERTDYRSHQTFAVDDDGTVEIDDALTARDEGGDTVVGVHIADVAAWVLKNDLLDREGLRRSSTVYLPNVTVPMFPPRLATDLASLVPGSPRRAVTVEARFSGDGVLLGFRFFRSIISVTDRLNYTEADQALDAGNAALTRLHRVARTLRDMRLAQGAQTHSRPDVKVHIREGRIEIDQVNPETPSRLIVSEMMILANRLAAEHAASAGIPIIFRTQEAGKAPRPDIVGLPEAIQFELLRRNFKRSRFSLHPSPHSGLGLAVYTQMTSPIRRYADLITQRQFTAALEGRPLPYEKEELLDVITACETREVEVRRLEQTSSTWWILTFLGRERVGMPLEGIVIDEKGTVELTGFLVRGRLKDREGLEPGDSVTVRIASVDPEHGGLKLEPVQ